MTKTRLWFSLPDLCSVVEECRSPMAQQGGAPAAAAAVVAAGESTVLEEEIDPDYEPTDAEILE